MMADLGDARKAAHNTRRLGVKGAARALVGSLSNSWLVLQDVDHLAMLYQDWRDVALYGAVAVDQLRVLDNSG